MKTRHSKRRYATVFLTLPLVSAAVAFEDRYEPDNQFLNRLKRFIPTILNNILYTVVKMLIGSKSIPQPMRTMTLSLKESVVILMWCLKSTILMARAQ
jgi:hypothetical protein